MPVAISCHVTLRGNGRTLWCGDDRGTSDDMCSSNCDLQPATFNRLILDSTIKAATIFLAFTAIDGQAPAGAWQMKQAPIMTDWAQQVNTNNPLPEYPRPQMVRTNWLNLNGIWQFQAGNT